MWSDGILELNCFKALTQVLFFALPIIHEFESTYEQLFRQNKFRKYKRIHIGAVALNWGSQRENECIFEVRKNRLETSNLVLIEYNVQIDLLFLAVWNQKRTSYKIVKNYDSLTRIQNFHAHQSDRPIHIFHLREMQISFFFFPSTFWELSGVFYEEKLLKAFLTILFVLLNWKRV